MSLHTIAETSTRKRVFGLAAICLLLAAVLLGIGGFYNTKIRVDLARDRAANAAPRTEAVLYGTRDTLLNQPRDVALASDGSIYVADSGNARIAVFDDLGALSYIFGAEEELKGVRTKVSKPSLMQPVSIAISKNNEIAVADSGRAELLIFNMNGELLREEAFRDQAVSHVAYGPDEAGDEVLYAVTSTGIARTDKDGAFTLFVPFTKTAEGRPAQVISGIDIALSKDGKPIVCLTDASAGTLITIDNFATGLRIIGEMKGAQIPNGVAAVTVKDADPTLWVSEAGAPSILEITSSDIVPGKGISTYGTGDGALLAPAGIDADESRIAVADPLNNRVTVYRAKESAPSVSGRISGTAIALLASAVLALLGALTIAVFYLRTRLKRYTFDASALERADKEGILDDIETRFEQYVPNVVVAQPVQEFAYRAIRSVPVNARAVPANLLEEIQLRYAFLDELDIASMALAKQLKHTHTLVTDSTHMRDIAHELGISVLTYDNFIALTHEPDEAPVNSLGKAVPTALMLTLMLTLVLVLGLPLSASAARERTIINVADLKAGAPLITSTTKPDPEDPAIENAAAPDAHAVLKSACSACHGSKQVTSTNLSTVMRASSVDQTSRLCATCHGSSSLTPAAQPFSATGGDISHFSSTQSGHRMGLASGVPASKMQTTVALSCGSCHPVHGGVVKPCSTCHDQAVFDQPQGTGLGIARTFDLSVQTRAHGVQKSGPLPQGHPSPLQTDHKATEGRADTRAQASVSVVEDGCYECHRGDLATDDSCKGCHYSAEDFAADPSRKARTSNWPHVDNSPILLGNNAITPASQKPTQEKIRAEACARCHPLDKGPTHALSPHAVNHDATLATLGAQIKGPQAASIEATKSPGYVATGRFSNSPLTMLVPEVGDLITTYRDVKCTQCHNTSVQAEHALRTEKSCATCHSSVDAQGRIDYGKVVTGMDTKAFATCGTENSACHASNWHGFNEKRVIAAHDLRGTDPEDALQTQSGCAQERDGVPTCHAKGSSQSLFYFGSMDIASAHNDYWSAQNETHATNKKYEKTTVELTEIRGCGLCHSASTEKPKGAEAIAKAEAGGAAFTCTTCHNIARESYAEQYCLRATSKTKPIKVPPNSSELDAKALEYLRLLGQQQGDTSAPGQTPGESPGSSLQPGVSPTERSTIPRDATPTTNGIPIDSEFSIIGRMLSPFPSWMKPNQYINTLQNIK